MRIRPGSAGGTLLAAAIGIAACLMWTGWDVLNPFSAGWLQSGDRAMHTLGWWFFKDSPWGVPPGISPKLGLELSSSIALSDSLPLFAIPFKLIGPLLPGYFQYWGLWYLTCFILQAVFGYLIARELRLGQAASLLAAAFCVFQPALLGRLSGHMALGGHWTILVAIYLYVRTVPPRLYAWPLLLAAVAAVHGYLLAMCGALWVAALVQRAWTRSTRVPVLIGEVILVLAALGLVLWATGTTMVSSLGAGGFGTFKMNLLSPIDAAGRSYFLPELPGPWGDYEGMNYVGLGALLLAVLALVRKPSLALARVRTARWAPIFIVCVGLTLFALSNRVSFGGEEILVVPLPEMLDNLASVFRSSGRMFWPVGYLLLFAILAAATHRLGKYAVPLIGLALVLQVADTSKHWLGFRRVGSAGPAWTSDLQHPAWNVLGESYSRLRGIPMALIHPDWLQLSYFSLRHHIGTDAVYLGRVNERVFAARVAAASHAIATGELERDTIYVLGLSEALDVARHMAPGDLLAKLDGRIVFARGGADVLAAKGVEVEPYEPDLSLLPRGSVVRIDGEVRDRYLLAGWSGAEDWGIWSEGPRAVLAFKLNDHAAATLRIRAKGIARDDGPPQGIEVKLNGRPVAHLELSKGAPEDYEIALPAGLPKRNAFVEFLIERPLSPAEIDGGPDKRLLGMALEEFEVR